MLRIHQVPVDAIYIPLERRKLLDLDKARKLAEDILENGMKLPIMVRFDGKRHIIVEGLHRLEAARNPRRHNNSRLPRASKEALKPIARAQGPHRR